MIVENAIMERCSSIREKVINLKKQGFKTEPAFCKVLTI
jgi:hypothetical protein